MELLYPFSERKKTYCSQIFFSPIVSDILSFVCGMFCTFFFISHFPIIGTYTCFVEMPCDMAILENLKLLSAPIL